MSKARRDPSSSRPAARGGSLLLPQGEKVVLSLILLAAASPAFAASLSATDQADLRRAYEAAKLSTSEQPALRAERRDREPSPGFLLGAALGSWTAAAAQLSFDLNNPTAAGPPHVSQTGGDQDALAMDCDEEKTAFANLQDRSRAAALAPADVLGAAGVTDTAMADAWRAREAGPAKACR